MQLRTIKPLQILAIYAYFNITKSAKSQVTCFLLGQVKGQTIKTNMLKTLVDELLSRKVDNSSSFKITPTSYM